MLKATFHSQSEVFNSGTLTPLISEDFVVKDTCPFAFHFGDRTIGVKRYWEARAQGEEISRLVSVSLMPLTRDLFTAGSLVELIDFMTGKKEIYKIDQIQIKEDTAPASIWLTLTNSEIQVTDERTSV